MIQYYIKQNMSFVTRIFERIIIIIKQGGRPYGIAYKIYYTV